MKRQNKRNILIISGLVVLVMVIILIQVSLTKVVIKQTPLEPAPQKEMEVAVEILKQTVVAQITKNLPPEESKTVAPSQKTASVNGAMPPVSANYRKYIGFKRYSEEMTKRGAKFLIFSGSAKRLYELDLQRRMLVRTDIKKLVKGNYSSRSRVIFDEPALNHYLKLAKNQYGIADPEVHLLVPREFEARIASELKRQNISLQNISGFKGFYAYSDQGKLTLRLNQALTDRGVVRLDLAVEL
jgi:hypothetical protein